MQPKQPKAETQAMQPRRYRFDGQAVMRELNAWRDSDEGAKSYAGSASGIYLANRLERAFQEGMECALKLTDEQAGIPNPEAYRQKADALAEAVRHWTKAPGGLQGCWNLDFVEAALVEYESLSAPSASPQQK